MVKNERNSKRLMNSINAVYKKWQHIEGDSVVLAKRRTTSTNDKIFSEEQRQKDNRRNDIEKNGRVVRENGRYEIKPNGELDNIKGEYKNGTHKNSKTINSIIKSIQKITHTAYFHNYYCWRPFVYSRNCLQ